MGLLYLPVNLTKKEFIAPEKLGCGETLMEQASWINGTATALILLLADEWKGDKVAMISSDEETAYNKVKNNFTEISGKVKKIKRYRQLVKEQKKLEETGAA